MRCAEAAEAARRRAKRAACVHAADAAPAPAAKAGRLRAQHRSGRRGHAATLPYPVHSRGRTMLSPTIMTLL